MSMIDSLRDQIVAHDQALRLTAYGAGVATTAGWVVWLQTINMFLALGASACGFFLGIVGVCAWWLGKRPPN